MTSVAPFTATALSIVVLGAAACSSSYSTDSGGTADAAPGDASVFTNPDAGDLDATSDAGLHLDATAPDAGSCIVQETGLVAYYPFDLDTGARDCSGNGHDGVVTNGGSGTGKIGGALQLKGDGCVDLGADASFVQNGDFTVALWVNIAMTTGAAQYLVGKAAGAPTMHGWRLAWEGQNPTVSLKIGTPAGPAAPASGDQQVGKWMHVAGVFARASRTEVWVNGVLAGSVAGSPPAAIVDDATARFRIGCGESTDYVVGSIDEVRMYNRALSAAEIATLAK